MIALSKIECEGIYDAARTIFKNDLHAHSVPEAILSGNAKRIVITQSMWKALAIMDVCETIIGTQLDNPRREFDISKQRAKHPRR